MLQREYCYSLRLQRSHSTNATIIRDGCSRSLAQLRRKAHAKLKKNSVNLKCKLLQIFPTVVDKLLCPHGQIAGWNGGAICIPSNTVVRLKHSFWDETVFILCCFFFYLGGGGLLSVSKLQSLQCHDSQLKSGFAFMFEASGEVKEWTVWNLRRNQEEELEEESSHWLACSPDTSASSAVAMGNRAAASCRPVHLHWEPQAWLLLSLACLCRFFQLYAKLQAIKVEIKDVNDEHVRSRQELEQTQNELTRELKFKWVNHKSQRVLKNRHIQYGILQSNTPHLKIKHKARGPALAWQRPHSGPQTSQSLIIHLNS